MAKKNTSNLRDLTPSILRQIRDNTERTVQGLARVERQLVTMRQEIHADAVAREAALRAEMRAAAKAAEAKYTLLERRVLALERR